MIIDVGDLEKGMQSAVKFEETLLINESADDLCNKAAVCFEGIVSNTDGKYLFKGTAAVRLTLTCDRCLEKFEKELFFPVNEVYVRGNADEEKDEISFEGCSFDTEEALKMGIALNMPMKAVCKDECKGLCYKCGRNLNISECGCDRTYVNPFFEDIEEYV